MLIILLVLMVLAAVLIGALPVVAGRAEDDAIEQAKRMREPRDPL